MLQNLFNCYSLFSWERERERKRERQRERETERQRERERERERERGEREREREENNQLKSTVFTIKFFKANNFLLKIRQLFYHFLRRTSNSKQQHKNNNEYGGNFRKLITSFLIFLISEKSTVMHTIKIFTWTEPHSHQQLPDHISSDFQLLRNQSVETGWI